MRAEAGAGVTSETAAAETPTAAVTLAGEDEANVVRVKKRAAKGKGKAREPRPKGEDEAKPSVKKEEEGETKWQNGMFPSTLNLVMKLITFALYYLVVGSEAGPSSRRIRRPRESRRDVAELYSRIQSLEAHQAARLEEVRQDIDRVESNVQTHRQYFSQEIVRLEERSLERSELLQQQVNSVREQTQSISDSGAALQRNAQELTESLRTITSNFQNMHFDIPNILDDWLRLRTGEKRDTVSGEQLHTRWGGNQATLPPLLPYPHFPLLQPHPAPPPQPDNSDGVNSSSDAPAMPNDAPDPTPTGADELSPSKFMSAFMYSQPTRDLETELDRRELERSSGEDPFLDSPSLFYRRGGAGDRSLTGSPKPTPVIRQGEKASADKSPKAMLFKEKAAEDISSAGLSVIVEEPGSEVCRTTASPTAALSGTGGDASVLGAAEGLSPITEEPGSQVGRTTGSSSPTHPGSGDEVSLFGDTRVTPSPVAVGDEPRGEQPETGDEPSRREHTEIGSGSHRSRTIFSSSPLSPPTSSQDVAQPDNSNVGDLLSPPPSSPLDSPPPTSEPDDPLPVTQVQTFRQAQAAGPVTRSRSRSLSVGPVQWRIGPPMKKAKKNISG
jgi:hypothetical protein